ncbi:MAG: 4-hydroxy-tetrahydrodipicolinate reductase [Clostridia bacterium]|nr:4-hydroxy-tetrahydrodipicolinate reductase [Clostridia bacterium]MBQ7751970.1 4-hydroxy-tetrahydrodipicolinate reductase [Clostridia bacterium]
MTNIILSGANGRMGRAISEKVLKSDDCRIVAGYDINDFCENPYPVFTDIEKCNIEADVIVDFSHPSAFSAVLSFAKMRKLPLIVATTGLSKEQKEELFSAKSEIPVFYSANMSLGINLLINLCKNAASVLGDKFDIEIVEKHHNKKLDAPSGTALSIADGISDVLKNMPEYVYDRHSVRRERSKNEIGIHSVRGGNIVGEHEVIFAGEDEVITLTHSAASREVFASGAVAAAKFMKGKSAGLYSMNELIGEML